MKIGDDELIFVGDNLNRDGMLGIEIEADYGVFTDHIRKDQAIEIINHLAKVFGLEIMSFKGK